MESFSQRRDFKALGLLGWLRVLEVTRNAHVGTYHPHFHVVLVAPAGCWLRITLGGSGVGSWPRGMILSCLSICECWMALNRL